MVLVDDQIEEAVALLMRAFEGGVSHCVRFMSSN